MANEIGLESIFRDKGFLSGISDYMRAVKEGESSTTSASSKITQGLAAIGGTIVTGALAVASAAIATAAGAAIAAVPAFLNWAETLDGVGDVLGTSSEESAALAVAILGVGGNVDQMTAQMAFLTRGLTDADGKLGPTGEAMKALGIEFKDADGNLLSSTDILTNVADVVGNMPDGLDKTKKMMALFGKSGKDLSDVMGALANGGLSDADKLAKELGLSLGDDATDGAIQLGREFNKLKMVGQGLLVGLGKDLMPAVTQLTGEFMKLVKGALPEIKKLLPQITGFIMDMAKFVIANIPVVFKAFSDVFNFLINNKPLIVGALAAIATAIAFWAATTIAAAIPAAIAFVTAMWPAVAVMLAVGAVVGALAWAWENNFMGMRDTLTAFWEGTVKPALEQLWAWLSVNVPLAIQTLSAFWTNVLLPAILSVWAWIQANIFPMLANLWTWLSINVPLAIQTLTNFWTNTLLPAITAVWAWIQAYLIPLFLKIAELVGVVVTLAVRVLAGLWQNVLLPAMQTIWAYISDNLLPIFQKIGEFIDKNLRPIFEWLAKFVGETLVKAWGSLGKMVKDLIGLIDRMIERLKRVTLPSWLTPGSPTPFEIGLRGIGDAMKQLSNAAIPAFRTELNAAVSSSSSPSAALGMGTRATPSAAGPVSYNTFNFGENQINNNMDAAAFTAMVRNVVRAEMRG